MKRILLVEKNPFLLCPPATGVGFYYNLKEAMK